MDLKKVAELAALYRDMDEWEIEEVSKSIIKLLNLSY